MPSLRRIAIRALSVILSALLVHLGSLSPVAAVDPAGLDGIKGLSIIEGLEFNGHNFSYVKAQVTETKEILCADILDPNCKNKVIGIAAYLRPCSEQSTVGCISEVYAMNGRGEKRVAKFIRTLAKNPKHDFKEIPARKVVAGEGIGGLWTFDQPLAEGLSNLFSVKLMLTGWTLESSPSFAYESMRLAITSVEEVKGNYEPNRFLLNSEGFITGGQGGSEDCVVVEEGVCFKRSKLSSDYRFGIKFRIPNRLKGWFHGRFSRPEFNISQTSTGGYEYQVEAAPIVVPVIKKEIPRSNWSPEFNAYAMARWPMASGWGYLLPGNYGQLSLEMTKLFLPMINDKSTSSGDHWMMSTLDPFMDGGIREIVDDRLIECSVSPTKVSGIVTTNALVYSAGPPKYNSATESLDYKVLSPHFDENGKENIGTYDLLIDASVARCVYGFSSAPLKAQIEVIGSDGNNKVATTIFGEKGDWLVLSATGFTYSDPTIKVKLSQEKVAPSPAPTPTATPIATSSPLPVASLEASPTPSANQGTATSPSKKSATGLKKVVSINCKKGSQLKIISAKSKAKLSCPKGWKSA